MSKDILSEYGQDSGAGQHVRATNGGKMEVKDLPYSPPHGPSNQKQQSPSIHGTNYGNCGSQGKH